MNAPNACPPDPGAAPVVLIVEDEMLVRMMIADALTDHGYRVLEAGDADEGLALLRGERVDALLTDIRLPGRMDGWRLAEEARTLHPRLAVIYATGYSSEAPRAVPDSVVLMKPYLPSAVVQSIERLTANPSGDAA
jgi:CheY-like chemotaxis protein